MINKKIEDAYSYIIKKGKFKPKVGIILGSGLGGFADTLKNSIVINFKDIPNFPMPTVEGHSGAFVFGKHNGIDVVAIKGRLHFYEGFTQQEITMPVRILKKLGVESLIITNAAGGINNTFKPGKLMIIADHINFSGTNPLIGPNLEEYGPRFPDSTNIYTKSLRDRIKIAAKNENINIAEGVYLMYTGPNYETPAEIRFFKVIGADAVGMSTVPEAIVASHCGINVIGISCITNMASGISEQILSHTEVIEVANKAKNEFTKLLSLSIGQCLATNV